ncbi:hypothetical protein [Afipia sp. GAS231]|uniref:hypothetical protein n=1 Tax=Afipia sp. GAS231 TaxID=1882747 RepID=UPI0012F8D2A9|nr:hypothetical protein [Afipia sp. GAS231]
MTISPERRTPVNAISQGSHLVRRIDETGGVFLVSFSDLAAYYPPPLADYPRGACGETRSLFLGQSALRNSFGHNAAAAAETRGEWPMNSGKHAGA